ncbi:MAG: STAS domain-containing protein [Candidatus Muirbacterium halophilum]|nr:STAS domain-containing protein [Candidatus Muirbacterium halophilum]
MKYAIKYFNEVCIIELSGRIDFISSQFLDKILENRISKGNFKIIIDFESVEYIGSNGLSVLINKLIECKDNSGDIKFIRVSADILNMVKNLRLDKIFDIFDSVENAIDGFYIGGENGKN